LKIVLEDIGRRYNKEWIFRHIHSLFEAGKRYAILGPNGSGKSTFLKVLSGSLTASQGQIKYSFQDQEIPVDQVFNYIAIATPYIELIEELSLDELIDFHFKFKSFLTGFDKKDILDILGLEKSLHKEVRFFSSGMKQRLKLVLACCTDAPVVFLDEPTSNLDSAGEDWYIKLIEQTISANRILIVCSNQAKEYSFCDQQLHIMDYK